LSLLLGLFTVPIVFFPMPVGGFDLVSSFRICCGCIYIGALVGVVPWLGLGLLLARNASFHPGWTGAWAGVSAFLLGAGAIQLHCPAWDMEHVMLGHLFPVALMTVAAAWVGTGWFSKWRR
jgi:hypothetical protein